MIPYQTKIKKLPGTSYSGEILHRFAGLTFEGELFYVQIKEDKRSSKKYFMSCFPVE